MEREIQKIWDTMSALHDEIKDLRRVLREAKADIAEELSERLNDKLNEIADRIY